jgi:class 3 adenylate cyclase
MTTYGALTNSIIRQINKSRKSITILFTDIEDSTKYWDTNGDIKGRLMLDQHNRLTFPVVKRFGGKIIKTIGDAIMASFKDPDSAMRAAIGMQQALNTMREQDRSFQLRVRIGVHTGKAIVEDNDVFGDVVNVAARVESQAKGNEILVSYATVSKLEYKPRYHLTKKGSVALKGKRDTIVLYRCGWEKCADLTRHVRFRSWLPIVPGQQKELLLYIAAIGGLVYFLYLKYLRYVICDSEEFALLLLNPSGLWNEKPVELSVIGAMVFAVLLAIFNMRRISYMFLHFIKGGFGFVLLFVPAYLAIQYAPLNFGHDKWDETIYQSKHVFAEVLVPAAPVYERANTNSRKILQLDKGHLLLLSDVATLRGHVWNKVLIEAGRYGWIERVTRPRLGVASQRLTMADKFYFRYRDLYVFLAGFVGFVWGWLNFRLKPT